MSRTISARQPFRHGAEKPMKTRVRVGRALACGWLLCSFFCTSNEVDESGLEPLGEIHLGSFTKTQYPIQYEEAILIAESWKKLGLEVRLEPLNFPNPVVERLFQTREFDAFVIYFTPQLERLEPDFWTYNTFHSSNAGPGGWNITGLASEEFDRLAEAQRVEYDLEKRKTLIRQCQEVLYREAAWNVIVNQDELQAYNKENFKDPVIPKPGGFKDPMAFFTIKPVGDRKVIRWAVEWAGLKTINPLLVSESTQVRLLHFVYDTLVRIAPDTKPHLWAATNIDSINETTFDVTIRDDMQFHDGKRVTTDDVAFTFEFMLEHKAVYFRAGLDPIASVEALDSRTVRFHLNHPYTPFVAQTLGMVPLLPRHVWETMDNPTQYRNIPPVGSGPFKFDHWKETQELSLSRFQDHFEPPHVQGVLVVFYGTREAVFTALKRGETDVVDILLPHQMEELKQLDFIQTVQLASHGSDSVIFNVRRPPFSDPQLRLALTYAIPRQQILEELYTGYGNLGASIIAPANPVWTHSELQPYPYDLDRAREILRQAGYRTDSRGRLSYEVE